MSYRGVVGQLRPTGQLSGDQIVEQKSAAASRRAANNELPENEVLLTSYLKSISTRLFLTVLAF